MKTALTAALRLSAGIVLFIGLPLAGWGFGDIRGFLSHPARLGYTALMVLLQAVAVACFPGAGHSHREGRKLVSRQRVALALVQVLMLSIVLAGPYCDHRQVGVLQDGPVRYLGLALLALGFVGMLWAAAALGPMFSVHVTIQEGHRLVTRGLYRHVRHPRYLGIVVFSLGIALIFNSWWALVLVLALAAVLLWRIHDEESLLHAEFGGAWEAYAKTSWRLIPFVY